MTHRIHQAGFSLLEMLVAISLFTLLMSLLFTTSNTIWKKWLQLESQQKRASEAHLLLQKMTRDLRSAVVISDSFFIDLSTIDPSCKKNLFFLTNSSSKLRAIGYFFVEEKNIPNSYTCYRFSASDQQTRDALQDKNLYALFATASPSNSSSCQQVASGILAWSIKPAWMVDGEISETPPQASGNKSSLPKLLELEITTDNRPRTSASKRALAGIFHTDPNKEVARFHEARQRGILIFLPSSQQ